MNTETKTCQNCKNQFAIEPDDFAFYETIHVPPPTWCPECRLERRIASWGYRMLYKRKCDFTGEETISAIHPDVPLKAYKQDIWWSDKWDPKEYGKEFDPSRPFLAQWRELLYATPWPVLFTDYTTMINSEYCNAAGELKNCYLCFKSDYSENCAYTNVMTRLKECFDAAYCYEDELCYDILNSQKCYQVFYSQNCTDCYDIWFSKDLAGCTYCIGCVNLRNKKYHIFNEPVSKEEYERRFKKFNFASFKNREAFRKRVNEFILKHPRKEFYGRKNVNISGDYISNSKNVHDSFMVGNGEDLRYCQLLKNGPSSKSYDHTGFGVHSEWIYESAWVGLYVNNLKFSFWNYHAHDLEYCFGCHGAENLFGCVGLRKGRYCILNKQYSKEEYGKKVSEIKEHMSAMPFADARGRKYRYGDFFPVGFFPWGYNETTGIEFLPLDKAGALQRGFLWRDPDPREYQDATAEIPDHINDVSESVLDAILKCQSCGKNYRVIKKEFDFYKKYEIPIPRDCPLCRDRKRIALLNPMKLYNRTCAKCGKVIKTSYAPERPEIVYCEPCYQTEVV